MAIDKKQAKSTFPVPAYNYRVRIGLESHAFSQVSGLSFQYDTITYRHGLSNIEGAHHVLGLLQPINVTLQRGIVAKGSLLLEWISHVHSRLKAKQDLTIDLCDEKGEPIISWHIQNALPTAYEAGEFDANTSDVAFETITLIANGMRVNYIESEQVGGTRNIGFSL